VMPPGAVPPGVTLAGAVPAGVMRADAVRCLQRREADPELLGDTGKRVPPPDHIGLGKLWNLDDLAGEDLVGVGDLLVAGVGGGCGSAPVGLAVAMLMLNAAAMVARMASVAAGAGLLLISCPLDAC